jgi:hypothetical protein
VTGIETDSGGGRKKARLRQRKRRLGMTRIDYYPDVAALAVITSLRKPFVGGDASSILNRIVSEWSARQVP